MRTFCPKVAGMLVIWSMVCVCPASAVETAAVKGRGPSALTYSQGLAFRQISLRQFSRPFCEDNEAHPSAGFRAWIDSPEMSQKEAPALQTFIGGLLGRTRDLTRTCGTKIPKPVHLVKDIGTGLAFQRETFFKEAEEESFPGYKTVLGTVDFSDQKYVGYTISVNWWLGDNNSGTYTKAHGVYGRRQGRLLVLSDFFRPETMPKLTALVQEAYAHQSPGGYIDSFVEFRRKFPKTDSFDEEKLDDPRPSENFSISKNGMFWSFEDRSIVGYDKMRKEEPLVITVDWHKLKPLLKNADLLPDVVSER